MAPINPITEGFWIYNTIDGTIKHVNFAQWFGGYSALGYWRGFTNKPDAEKYKKDHPPLKNNDKSPGNIVSGIVAPGTSGTPTAGLPGAGSLTDISGFVSALTQRNTWLRIGEGILGLLLVGIGIAAVTRGTPVGAAVRKAANVTPVGKVAKVLK